MKLYRVRIGGSPATSGEVFERIDAAEEFAIDLAVQIAEQKNDDVTSIAVYGGQGESEWGACPDGDEGGYYPVIEEE
jgi:hypothetical protein